MAAKRRLTARVAAKSQRCQSVNKSFLKGVFGSAAEKIKLGLISEHVRVFGFPEKLTENMLVNVPKHGQATKTRQILY